MSNTLGTSKRGFNAPFSIPSGTVEGLKWLALVLMTLDHVNKYLFAEALPGVFELGRITMPLFGFVLAYNLSRASAFENGMHLRIIKRLAFYGALATPFFCLLGGLLGGWWPLNILFMLLVATAMIYLVDSGKKSFRWAAVLVFIVGGGFVEFWWFGLAFCAASWFFCKNPSTATAIILALAASSLYAVNKNFWAVAVLPLCFYASHISLDVSRVKKVFYVYYPAHLAALFFISQLTGLHL